MYYYVVRKILSLFVVLLICCSFLGCGNTNPNLYFYFNFNNLDIQVGDSINVYEQDLSANFFEYAQMHIYSSDDEIVEVNGDNIIAKSEGSSTIIVSGFIEGYLLTSNFIVNVFESVDIGPEEDDENNNESNTNNETDGDINLADNHDNNNENSNNDSGAIEDSNENDTTGDVLNIVNYNYVIDNNIIVYDMEITLNNNIYYDFIFNVISGNENIIGNPKKILNILEIKCLLGGKVVIKIYTNDRLTCLEITLPYQGI